MRSKVLTAALCVLVLGWATRADAFLWSVNGAACAPGDPAIQANRYAIGAGSVKHQVGASGLITLYCEVAWSWPACSDDAYLMRQTYTDSDATGTAVHVRSTLYRMSKGNGAIAPVVGASVHSNAYPDTASTNHTAWFQYHFEPQSYSYYVRVDLDRVAGSVESAIFYSVAIECD